MRKIIALTSSLALVLALAAHALHRGNAGPTDFEIKFHLPPPEPLTPEKALGSFQIEPGYRMELVAAEPLVEAPVAISFDDQGRLYVVEMRGFMRDAEGRTEQEPLGRIRLLTDTDGDGRMDKATTFLDQLVLPRSVMAVNGGALVGAPPQLLFCKDTDGDGVADVKEVVADDYGTRTGQPEHMANTPVWCMDNAVWSAGYSSRLRLRGGVWTRDTGLGRGQYGLCQDDAGRPYFNYNSDLLRCDLLPAEAFSRNPLLRNPASVNVKLLRDQTVWPGHPTPGVNRGYEPKTLREDGSLRSATATCGALIYRGDAMPSVRGNAFIPEPAGNLVKRVILTEKDGVVSGANALDGKEFLTSTDERFRPVQAADGPDGALYIVDMYRGIIQHSGFLTHYLVANIAERKLAQPIDMGRIWRVLPDKASRPQATRIPADTAGRIASLSSPSGWVRDTAQRLLVESGDATAAAPLAALVKDPAAPALTRLHAVWTLDGLGLLTPEVLRAALTDSSVHVRAAAARLMPREMTADLIRASTDAEVLVRAHAAIRLAALTLPEADAALADMLAAGGASHFLIREGALTGMRGREHALAALLAAKTTDASAKAAAPMLEALAAVVAQAGKPTPVEAMLTVAAGLKHKAAQSAVLAGLGAESGKKGAAAKLIWLDAEPAALAALRQNADSKRLAAAETRLAWPGKPGAPEPPKITPLTAAQTALFEKGRTVFTTLCAACHQPHGLGLDGLAPPLVDSEWVLGQPDVPVRILLHGMAGPVKVAGRNWNLAMPPLPQLTDDEMAGVITYIRREWDHTASPVEPSQVAAMREKHKARQLPWTAAELKK